MEQLENLKMYFLKTLPTQSAFKKKNGVGSSERYKRIKSALEHELLLPIMCFIVFGAQSFKPFMLMFQKEEPMVHVLYPEMRKLVIEILGKFLIETKLKELASDVKMMIDYVDDADWKKDIRTQPNMGTKTIELLNKNVKDKLVKKWFVKMVKHFCVACAEHLLKNLLLNKQVLYDVQYLHPMLRTEKILEKPIKRLAGTIAKCLGESFHDTFEVEKSCSVEDFQDIIKTEIDFFRMETIPESMILHEKPKDRPKTTQKTSYWEGAFMVAGVRDDKSDDDTVYRRVDNFWLDVLEMKDVVSGKQKYKHLAKLALCGLVLSHGNAEPTRKRFLHQ